MRNADLAEYKSRLEDFSCGMLVTRRGDDELRSRPMEIAGVDDDGNVWFVTSVDSGKVEELTEFPFVNLVLQDGQMFMSVSGTVRVTRDPDAIDKYWSREQRVWFDKGRDDPELVMLEVIPTYAEYWDREGIDGIRFLLAEARAIVTGETLSGEDTAHKKIPFPS